ncbi:MAG: Uma2 family endonuclease [Planctomycetaceae bacterium]|nr:Uma2 family endonuclease [Planctomycetaceae bacterium]
MSTPLKLTVAEYGVMVEKGAFDELTQKIELINGELSAMNPAGPVHDDYIQFLCEWSFQNTDRQEVKVRVQSGITLPELDSRPEPDVCWVRPKRYLDGHPTARDVWLIIEVSDSSLKSDQQEKEELYAKAGIPEYWIVDITHELIHVHRDPAGGRYESIEQFGRDQCLAPQVQPAAVLVINELLGGS